MYSKGVIQKRLATFDQVSALSVVAAKALHPLSIWHSLGFGHRTCTTQDVLVSTIDDWRQAVMKIDWWVLLWRIRARHLIQLATQL